MRAVQLQGMQLRTTAGRPLGRLFDLKARTTRGRQGEALLVFELVAGERGWMERLGLRRVRTGSLPWTAVRSVDIDGGVIVLDDAVARFVRG